MTLGNFIFLSLSLPLHILSMPMWYFQAATQAHTKHSPAVHMCRNSVLVVQYVFPGDFACRQGALGSAGLSHLSTKLCGYSNQYAGMVDTHATYLVTLVQCTGATSYACQWTCFWYWLNQVSRQVTCFGITCFLC